MNNEEKNSNYETEELENKDSSKKVLLGIFGTMILVVAVIGVSFAMFYFSMKLSNENSLTTGTISMAFQDTTYIDIEDALPMTDAEGMAMTGDMQYMDFTVTTNISGKTSIFYEISAVDETITDENVKVPYENLKIYIYDKDNKENAKPILYSDLEEPTLHDDITGKAQEKDKLLLSDIINNEQGTGEIIKSYRLKMWIDEKTEDVSIPKTFKLKVRLDAVQK